jgi:hypothetical protein
MTARSARYTHIITLNQDEEDKLQFLMKNNYSITEVFRIGLNAVVEEKD